MCLKIDIAHKNSYNARVRRAAPLNGAVDVKRVLAAIILVLSLTAGTARAAGTEVYISREVSSAWVPAGGYAALSYTLRASGDGEVRDIVITDPLVGEVARLDSLKGGERVTVTLRAQIHEDVVSAPEVRYTASGYSRSRRAGEMTLLVEDADLVVACAPGAGEVAVTVTNRGRAPIRHVRLSEAALGDMGEAAVCLQSGESAEVTWPARAGTYHVAASALSMSGQAVEAEAPEVRVEASAAEGEGAGGVTMAARLTDEGIALTVTNDTGEPLQDAVIEEAFSGQTRPLAWLPTGATEVLWPAYETDDREALLRVTDDRRLWCETALNLEGRTWTQKDALVGERVPAGPPARTIALGSAAAALALAAAGIAALLAGRRKG